MKIPNCAIGGATAAISLARIVSEDSQLSLGVTRRGGKSSKDS